MMIPPAASQTVSVVSSPADEPEDSTKDLALSEQTTPTQEVALGEVLQLNEDEVTISFNDGIMETVPRDWVEEVMDDTEEALLTLDEKGSHIWINNNGTNKQT